jgi:hypothetical protein
MGKSRRRRPLCLIVLAALLATAALASSASAPAAKPKPVLFSKQCANRSYKPTLYAIACADARVTFRAKEYAQWEADEALASGVLTYPDCAPNVPLVACRKVAHDRATVRLYRPTFCPKKGRRYFTRLLMFDSEAPTAGLRRIKLKFPCRFVE